MPKINVSPEHRRAFVRCLAEWESQQPPEGRGLIQWLAPEGAGPNGWPLFIDVPELVLPFVTRHGIPFERDREGANEVSPRERRPIPMVEIEGPVTDVTIEGNTGVGYGPGLSVRGGASRITYKDNLLIEREVALAQSGNWPEFMAGLRLPRNTDPPVLKELLATLQAELPRTPVEEQRCFESSRLWKGLERGKSLVDVGTALHSLYVSGTFQTVLQLLRQSFP